jgi:hypothetical protein
LRLLQEGPLDHESDSFETLYYDANGNITRHENTEFDQAYEIWLYDTEGKVTRHELHAEGANHHRIGNWRYDTRGNMSSFETYLEEDIGGTNRIDIRTYLYDLDSNPTQESFIIEENGNTNSHVVGFLYEYDKLGRLQQFTSKDNDGFNSWKFNARGNAIHREEHNGNNAEIWFYNSDGNVTRHEGSFPWSPEIWQYNADGKLVRYEQQNTWCDRGCYRLATTWEYDDSGHVVLRKLVNLEDDSVLEVDAWQYDESGRVILRKGDPLSGDEIITETWQYYANGLVKRHVIDGGNEELENQYDSKGNMTREAIFSFPETEKSIETWNYDVAGNLVYRGWDAGGVGIIDTATTYQYATTGWGHLFSGINVFGQPNRPPTKPSPAHEERPPE